MNIDEQARKATEMLKGKAVREVLRHRTKELLIEFTDGTRLFVDWQETEIEMSITTGLDESTPS